MLVDLMEKYAVLQSPSRIEELVKIFIHATKVRLSFPPHSSRLSDCRRVIFWMRTGEKITNKVLQMEIGFWEMYPHE